jgi:hypothetical protein
MSCPICNGEDGRVHIVREMMFATKEDFPYFECEECGCVSLQRVPQNFGLYYPDDYYSFNDVQVSFVRRLCYRLCLSSIGLIVKWLPFPIVALMPRLHMDRKKRLLDIGCGTGSFVTILRSLGYQAQGLDPFVSADIMDEFGLCVRKGELHGVREQFDVLVFLHSLEHMPVDALVSARKIIRSNGLCVVRIPIVNWAWQHFGTNWVQLDAPRHLFLHSVRSFQLLAKQSGFRVEKVVYDSVDFQFWGSEAYARGCSYRASPRPHMLKRAQMRLRAMALNHNGLGDQAQFYLRPI